MLTAIYIYIDRGGLIFHSHWAGRGWDALQQLFQADVGESIGVAGVLWSDGDVQPHEKPQGKAKAKAKAAPKQKAGKGGTATTIEEKARVVQDAKYKSTKPKPNPKAEA